MELQTLLRSRWMTGVLVAVLGVVGFVTVELYMQKRQVDAEVAKLEAQSGELSRNNKDLSELIKYMDTPEYKEREAREKLNLSKDGEQVVVLPTDDELAALGGQASAVTRSNPQKWFDYFFQ